MDLVAFKLTATPLLIAAATLAARRWGQAVGGWLVGLPLTSGPVILFLALDQGPAFAADATTGSLQGVLAQASFSVAFARFIVVLTWPVTFLLASAAYVAAALLIHSVVLSMPVLLLLSFVSLTLALVSIPAGDATRPRAIAPPRWDLPARMIVATGLVLGITQAAPALGPVLSGLVTTFPVIATTLAVFASRAHGPDQAVRALRGLVLGLYAFAASLFAIGETLVPLGIAAGFAVGIVVALGVQGLSLLAVQRLRLR